MPPTTARNDDLFLWIDALWNKTRPAGTFPVYVAHRFLASDQRLANFARVLRQEVRDADLIFGVWLGLLPSGRSPRLTYAAAKKAPAAEALVARIMTVTATRRDLVEASVEFARAAGREDELYEEFGVDRKGVKPVAVEPSTRRERGLFG